MKTRHLVLALQKRMEMAGADSTAELRHGCEVIVFDAAGAQVGDGIALPWGGSLPAADLPSITDDLERDALRALGRRLAERLAEGRADRSRPERWSDEAQTVGWCLDLLERWPTGRLRTEMVRLLGSFGYDEPRAA